MYKNNPFIVAEISANHLGNYQYAYDLIYAAKKAGADAVKFQCYTPEEMAPRGLIIEGGPWDGRSYESLYAEAQTPDWWLSDLFDHAEELGLVAFASPFSPSGVQFLENLHCPIYKIASPEIVYGDLIQAAAKTGKPLIISTGMASISEIHSAYAYAVAAGASDITFLHCISAYPAHNEDFNMRTLRMMVDMGFKVGLSDHSLDNTAAVMAVALGATVIEKHLCLRRALGGPDAAFSLEIPEFAAMVKAVRAAAAALGNVQYGCREAEQSSYQYRRSLWIVRDMKAGQVITKDDVAVLRPNHGIAPNQLSAILGRKVKAKVAANTPVSMELFK